MRPSGMVRSRDWQLAVVAVAFLAVAALKWPNDGLWFQGDAPRHAINGLFWRDLVTTMPRDPVQYALRYYARYPVISPATYPPLFYLVEGLAFTMFGPSPGVARVIVLLFAVMAGVYLMLWTREWIDPRAGWSAVLLAFVPGFVVWSNTVMLNVPATALTTAALYYFRRWLMESRLAQSLLAGLFGLAALLTYYPVLGVIAVPLTWALFHARRIRFDRRFWAMAGVALLALVPLFAVLLLTPVHTSRHLPTADLLTASTTWTYYWRSLPGLVGRPLLIAGIAGCVAGLVSRRWRVETAFVVLWIVVPILALSILPARDPRYILPVVPALVVAAAIGVAVATSSLPPAGPALQVSMLIVGLSGGIWPAVRTHVPRVSGFRELASYLKEHAPTDAVLYDGDYDGVFGFYVRSLDPNFERRLVLADKFLYYYGPTTTFRWRMQSTVASKDDVVEAVRLRSGCRWVAVETGPGVRTVPGSRLLREALSGRSFEHVRTFPILGAGNRRVELYRVLGDLAPVSAVDLRFPSLSDQTFFNVVPIAR